MRWGVRNCGNGFFRQIIPLSYELPTSFVISKRVLILATEGFEQSDLIEPKRALEQVGIETVIASPKRCEIRGWHHTD